jgi:predicted homoserine dehydrogenase-like protein
LALSLFISTVEGHYLTLSKAKKQIRFGIIGCGLMGREFASAAARWCHLLDLDVEPHIVAV